MKHIYLINSISNAAIYGIGTYVNQIVSCLKGNTDFYLTVVYLHYDCQHFTIEKDEPNQLDKIYIPQILYSDPRNANERYCRNTFYLLKPYIKDEDKNIFHFNYVQNVPLISLIKERCKDCKIIYTIHYFNWYFTLKGNISKLHSIISKDKEELKNEEEKLVYSHFNSDKRVFLIVDKIICLSNDTYSLLQEEYHTDINKIELINNGLEDAKDTNRTLLKTKSDMLFNKNVKILIYVGRLDDMKGLNSLLGAFQEVVKLIPNTHLLIIGEGDYNKYLPLTSGIWNKVSFTGRLSKEELYNLYQVADIGILPSLHEQCSYVLIEMLMFGLPVVGSSIFREILNEEHCVPIEVHEDKVLINKYLLAEYMINMLHSKNINLTKRSNRKIFTEKYTLIIMKKKLLKCYNNV